MGVETFRTEETSCPIAVYPPTQPSQRVDQGALLGHGQRLTFPARLARLHWEFSPLWHASSNQKGLCDEVEGPVLPVRTAQHVEVTAAA